MHEPSRGLTKHDLGMIAVSVIWGANFSANKVALATVTPFTFSAVRFVMASLVLAAVVHFLEPGTSLPGPARWRLIGLGLIGNTAYQAAFMTGLVHTTAINASLIMAALPVVVAGLATGLGIERPTRRLWWGISVATLGVVLVVLAKGGQARFSAATVEGDLLVLTATCCWALFTVGVRRVGAGMSPLRVTALTTYAGTPGLVLAALGERHRIPLTAWPVQVWLALLFSAIFAIVVAYVLWSYAVQGLGGSRTAVYHCVIPIVAAAVAWVVLGEAPRPAQGVGAALVLVGVLMSQGVLRLPTPPRVV
ncbi:MAG: DMT family transporter [Gemmatimonadota bacterium]